MGIFMDSTNFPPMPLGGHLRDFVYLLPPGEGLDVFPQCQLSERFPYCFYYTAISELVFPHGQPFWFSVMK